MASIKILDTGYISNDTLTNMTQLSDANRAGYTATAVSSFTLKTASDSMNEKTSTENKPIINTVTDSDTSLVSVGNRLIKVACILEKVSTTSGWSTNKEYQFMRLSRTRGLKLLYPSGVTDTDKTIIEVLGAINTNGNFAAASPTDDNGTVSTTTPYLIGRVKGISIKDYAPNKKFWRIDFDFEISA